MLPTGLLLALEYESPPIIPSGTSSFQGDILFLTWIEIKRMCSLFPARILEIANSKKPFLVKFVVITYD